MDEEQHPRARRDHVARPRPPARDRALDRTGDAIGARGQPAHGSVVGAGGRRRHGLVEAGVRPLVCGRLADDRVEEEIGARLLVDTVRNAVVVPTAAVQRTSKATFVYLVKSDSTIEVRNIDVGATEGDRTYYSAVTAASRGRGDSMTNAAHDSRHAR